MDKTVNDNLARTVRDFNGLGVGRFPLSGELPGRGVYALYCMADTGFYGRYGRSVNDCCFAKSAENLKLVRTLRNLYRPVWNEVFDDTVTTTDFSARWAKCHDLRFRPRNQSAEARNMRMTVQNLLRKVG